MSCSLNYLNGSLFGFAALAPLKADCLASLLACPKQKAARRLKRRPWRWPGKGSVPASARPGR